MNKKIYSKILKYFSNEEITINCTINNHKIDLYFPKYKLALINNKLDFKSKRLLEKETNCKIIIINNNIIDDIYINIKFNDKIINY